MDESIQVLFLWVSRSDFKYVCNFRVITRLGIRATNNSARYVPTVSILEGSNVLGGATTFIYPAATLDPNEKNT